MKLSSEQILNNKEAFINILKFVNRPGIDKLIDWLENKSDFFIAPSSASFHGAYDGGLCQHSLNVYDAATKLYASAKEFALPEKDMNSITMENIIIASLLHDLCKTNFYKKVTKVFKDDATNTWHHYYAYEIEDNFPLGHGEKSVIMAQNFIKLTGNEIVAMRWHMGAFDPGCTISPYEKPALNNSMNTCPLLVVLQSADVMASYLMEGMFDPKKENLID